jgi:uncharacterized protein
MVGVRGVVEEAMNGRASNLLGAAAAVVVLAAAVTGCAAKVPPADPAYVAELGKWRAERVTTLTGENGWLTLVGIHWLKPGTNRLGGASDNDIVLTGEGVPAQAGALELEPDGSVLLHAPAEAHVTSRGAAVTEMPLRTDRTGKPDVLTIGGLRMHLIDRGGAIALRVRDPKSPRRTGFKGIDYFAIDPRLKVAATFERYASRREVSVASAQGPAQKMLVPGILRFRIGDRDATLEPFVSAPADDSFFIVFSDATAGHETYGAGRFLDTDAPKAGASAVTLDFNQAYNPPCAFSPYATCPLPPHQNILPFRVEAGEKVPGSH